MRDQRADYVGTVSWPGQQAGHKVDSSCESHRGDPDLGCALRDKSEPLPGDLGHPLPAPTKVHADVSEPIRPRESTPRPSGTPRGEAVTRLFRLVQAAHLATLACMPKAVRNSTERPEIFRRSDSA